MPKTIETLIIAENKTEEKNIIVFVLELEPTSERHLKVEGKSETNE